MGNTTERFTIVGDLQLSVNNALGGINQLQDKLSKLKLPQQNQQELTSAYKKLQSEAQNYINIVSKGFKTKQDKKDLERSFGNIRKYINEWNTAFNNIDTKALKSAFDELNGGEIKQLTDSINQLDTQLKSLGKESSSAIKSSFSGIRESIRKNLQDSLKPEEYQSKLTELNKIFSSTATRLAENFGKGRFDLVEGNLEKLKERITELFKDTGVDNSKVAEFLQKISEASHNINEEKMKELVSSMEQFGTKLQGLETKNLEDTKNLVNQLPEAVRKGVQSFGELHDEEKRAADGAIQLNNEVDHLKSRITYFFGLANGVQLFRRALRDAVNTTKELDAVMTQTAVVSKNTVADMWKTLPEYSKEAKKLGAAIKDVYSAQTLYVQQGLEMNQAMELGVETLKMARVAGIDSAEATNSMTAALRGFNMELTETSALRVNDVYSKLAQNTASNVQEISTAMTKTAALANSANMSFENTAAFLATIIESTREGAETAGTALKTVIARFTEVKKLYSEGELTGTDEEGQEVDVNKISKALRTAGINMNEFFTGAKGLDEIFMELGSKWNSLTTVQQRYIATMAAGSRQQSRFLALMQNYSRTAELTEMAYNSAGSSQEQFEKTLDSLEAKLNQFKAAWDNFVMGIANSDFVKGAIDAGTKLLETINKIIDAISGGNGLVKSIASIATAVGVFKAGKGLAGLLISGTNGRGGLLGSIVGKLFGGKQAGETAAKGFLGSFTNAIKTGDTSVVKKTFTDFYNKNINWKNQINPYEQFGDHRTQNGIRNSFLNDVDQSSLMPQEKLKLQYTYDSEGLKSATDQAKEMGVTLDKTDKSMKAFKTNLNAIGNSCLMVGGALLALTSYLQSTGKIGDKTAKVLKGISAAFIAFGGVLKITQVAISVFSKSATASISSIPIIGWIAAAIAALIALSSAIADVAWETSAEKAERLANESERLKEKLEDLKSEYTDLEKKLDELKQQETGFDKLIKGTIEYDTALQNLNQSILSLIQLYPDLAKAVDYVNGKFVLNDEEYQKYLNKKKEELQDAQDMENIAELTSAYGERDSYGFWKGVWEGTKTYFLGYDNYEGKVKSSQGKIGNAVEDKSGTFNNVLSGFQMLFGAAPWKIFTADMYDRNGFYTDELNYLSEKIMEGTLIFDKNDDEKNKKSIETLLEFYKKDTGSTRDYNSDSSNVKEIYKVLKDYYSYLEDYGEKNKIIQQSKEKLKNNAIINTYGNTLASKTEYSNTFYKMAPIVYDKVQISDEEREIKQKQKTRSEVAIELGYKKASDISEENYKLWIDYAIIQEKLTKNLDNYYSSFLKLNTEQKNLFSRLVDHEGLEGLTITEVDSYTSEALQKDIDSLAETLNLTPEEINKLIGVTNLEEALEGLGKNIYDSLNSFYNADILKNKIESSKFQTVSEATTLAEKTTQIQKRGGHGEDFLNQINNFLENIDSDKVEDVKKLILGTNFDRVENIYELAKQLEELNISVGADFTSNLIAATNAVRIYSAETLKASVEMLEGAKSSYEKMLDGQRKFTEEEYAQFAELEGFNPKDWIKSGSNEYTYLGDITNILASIEGMITKLTKEQPKQLKERIQEANELKKQIETFNYTTATTGPEAGHKIEYNGFTIKDENGQKQQVNATSFTNAILQAENSDNFSIDQLKSFAEIIGVNAENRTAEQIFTLLQIALQDYGNIEGLEQQYAILEDEKTSIALQSLSSQQILNNEYDKETFDGYTTENLLDARLELGDKENVEYLKRVLNLSEDYDNVLKGLIADSKITQKNFDNLTKVYKDNADALTEEGKKTGQYGAALSQLTVAAKTAFNGNEKITEGFVESHLNDFKAMSEGSVEALQNIRKELLETGTGIEKVDNAVEQISGADFSITGTADVSDIINKLDLTKEEAEAAQKRLNELGYSAELQITYKDDGLGNQVPDTYRLVVTDTGSNTIKNAKSGGGGGSKKEFKNDFDKYYNMVEDINELERLRNLLETDYNQLLNSEYQTGKQIYDNLKQQIALLRERRDITADLAEKRKQQIIDAVAENSDLQKYAWWNNEDLTIEINWDLINSVKDSEEGDRIKEYVSILEDFQSKYDEQIEALEDIESTIQEIEKRGRDQYTSLEDRVRDALIKRIQDQIDELTASNEGINTANQNLLDSIQQTLSKQRQERENAKTEEELSDKEKRLEYLRQDSSGANALEIAQLEKELAEARENYTDQLIDQKISELQEQNDAAAEQRQEQIDLLQQSLDWQEKNGEFWEQAYAIMYAGIGPDGSLVKGSELEQLLKSADTWNGLSDEGKMNWLSELEKMVAEATGYLALTRQLEDIGTKAGSTITFTNAEGKTLTGVVDKNGNVVVTNADGSKTTYKDVYQDYSGNYRTNETSKDAKTEQKPATSTGNGTGTSSSSGGSGNGDDKTTNNNGKGWEVKPGKNNLEWIAENSGKGTLTEAQAKKLAEQKNAERLWDAVYNGKIWEAILTTYGKLVFKKAVQKANDLNASGMTPYKTGGLNTQTGPAWLDGTPSRPELVLNARDTENFIQLKDTLQDLRKASSTQNLGGDNYYDIDINVDKIDDDYDVDRLADRLKQLIYKDGQYRNVNVLNRLR